MFVHGNHLYLYGGFYKDGCNDSTYCNDFVALNLRVILSELQAAKSESIVACDQTEFNVDNGTSDVLVLRRMLAALDATSSMRYILDDGVDDDDIVVISRMQPHKMATKYKMTEDQAQQFVEMCALEQQQQLHTQSRQGESANELAHGLAALSIPKQEDNTLSIDDSNSGSKPVSSARLKSALVRRESVQNAFGNRMQMSSYSTLSQFHSGALHVALKSMFPHTADVDVLASDDNVDDLEVDDSDFFFRLRVLTLNEFGAGTDAEVFVILVDRRGRETNEIALDMEKSELAMLNERVVASGGLPQHITIDLFEKGSSDAFMIRPLIQEKFRPSDISSIKGDFVLISCCAVFVSLF
jgi:hypothetical protein